MTCSDCAVAAQTGAAVTGTISAAAGASSLKPLMISPLCRGKRGENIHTGRWARPELEGRRRVGPRAAGTEGSADGFGVGRRGRLAVDVVFREFSGPGSEFQ